MLHSPAASERLETLRPYRRLELSARGAREGAREDKEKYEEGRLLDVAYFRRNQAARQYLRRAGREIFGAARVVGRSPVGLPALSLVIVRRTGSGTILRSFYPIYFESGEAARQAIMHGAGHATLPEVQWLLKGVPSEFEDAFHPCQLPIFAESA